ncbi:MAG: hypothetical protein RBS89_08195 [Candidatus Delongbacteria bacterium]|jgi:cupin superfamily acireductone dioxygenase involved in methionine salvage|nr:hypothetical protein [Candidatus Delongbacteria bacterium]
MFTLYLSICVIVIGTIIAIAEKKDSKYRYLIYLYTLSSIAAIVLIVVDYVNKLEEDGKKLKQSKTIEKIDYQTSDINSKLDSLNEKALEAIAERKSTLARYNKVTEKLDKQIGFEKLDLKGKEPSIAVLTQNIRFIEIDSLKQNLEIRYINMGSRPAVEFNDEILCLVIDKNDMCIVHQINPIKNSCTIYPHSKGHFYTTSLKDFMFMTKDISNYSFFIFIHASYKDELMNTEFEGYYNFEWDYTESKFSKYNRLYIEEIESYLKENGLSDKFKIRL